MAVQDRFGVWDWIVFSVLLLVSVAIGFYYAVSGGKQKTTKEFLSGDRNMKVIPIAISILVSFQSAILIIGTPAEMYTVDSMFFINTFGSMLGCILTSILFVPLFYNLKTVSVYEYVELRFKSRAARVISSSISILSTINDPIKPDIFLDHIIISGFPEWASYLIMGSICTIYTFLGGLKAVVWVDAFQGLIMLAGILAIIIQIFVIDLLYCENVSRFFNPDPTIRHTFWSLVVGGTITTTGIYGTTQSSIQRFTALPSLTDAKIELITDKIF
ncbi:hypothetical protein KUTeg_010763 [Tegillarca granosa]|uniref:Sodium-dependent multivitamin transporter n=1 Tax=Tegillarca granosa TaxID=220873 RepID=A0ABQ9F1Y8_TEGGR|nr:hypothetical protein KUTeg_010763 [Tegillarca granosa]